MYHLRDYDFRKTPPCGKPTHHFLAHQRLKLVLSQQDIRNAHGCTHPTHRIVACHKNPQASIRIGS